MSTQHFERKAHLIQELRLARGHVEDLESQLALMEQYEQFMGLGTEAGRPFAELTKGDAAELILQEVKEAMPVRSIYDHLKARSHPVQSWEALRTLLEKDKRFVRVQPGCYALASAIDEVDPMADLG